MANLRPRLSVREPIRECFGSLDGEAITARVSLRAATHPVASERTLRVAGTAGMAMLPVFVLTVVLLTWLEWDFSHATGWTVLDEHGVNYPSALARGDLGFLQALNFFALGMLALVFGQGLRTQFVHRRSGAIATAGLVAVGLAGPFSAFATDLPGESATWHGLLHGIGFLLLTLGSVVTFIASVRCPSTRWSFCFWHGSR